MSKNKAVVTTVIDDYQPELCAYTLPNLKRYADSIGADFIQIKERKNNYHAAYEKLQVYDISEHYEKTLLVDADIILHPRLGDITQQVQMDQVGMWMSYPILSQSLNLWDTRNDVDFLRHGRNLGVVGALVCCTRWTRDLFKPLEEDVSLVQDRLYRPAIIDEYTMSKNLARYNLNYTALMILPNLIYHAEMTTINNHNSLSSVKKLIEEWQ